MLILVRLVFNCLSRIMCLSVYKLNTGFSLKISILKIWSKDMDGEIDNSVALLNLLYCSLYIVYLLKY